MRKTIKVYDEKGIFRELDDKNLNDDIVVGSILFSMEATNILSKYYLLLGYVLLDNDGSFYPIDIHDNTIILFEGVYNCLNEQCKKELIIYNITDKPQYLWSRFFFEWQFMLDDECFNNNGPLILLCSNLFKNKNAINYLRKNYISLYEPQDYEELGKMVNAILNAFEVNINKMDYDITFKYLIDSVINGYYIRLDSYQIKKCFYDVCSICNAVIKEKQNGEI